ncbi:DUF308 domain-containing protein [Methanoculleus sp. UBA303]|jgi:uncharacterized membrane protein HdeD (DUF308 family)|uniref:DUF308 domain-containing protein n=1 Tax=Methanoculleus sp. UBA303 TaxID=1915497 RepID=UPI0025ED6C70|nr:DUF308 domain-containing protein [Methanoculleus sp. UBA303]
MVNATFEAGTPGLTKPASLPRWLVLLQGIVALALGILFLAYPLYSTILLPTLLAIIIGVEGLIIGAVQLARGLSGAGWGAGILGIVSIIFGLILIANPFIAALALVVVLAVLAIIGGVAAIIFALRMPG